MSSIENKVCIKILNRAEIGEKKYKTTMERTDLSELDWLVHAQEEAMDLAIYLEKLIQVKKNESDNRKPIECLRSKKDKP